MTYDVVIVGSCVTDLTFYTVKNPKVGETVVGTFDSGLGGKGFNQAVASARTGAKTLFIGAIGADSFGKEFSNYNEPNLTIKLFTIPSKTTGAASINVDSKGQNSIVVALGANTDLTLTHISTLEKDIKKAKVLLLQRENSDKLLNELIKYFRKVNPKGFVILNPAPSDKTINIKQEVDLITPNETELMTLAGIKHLDVTNKKLLQKAIKKITKTSGLKFKEVIVTLGELGSYYNTEEALLKAVSLEAPVVDTSGAGDAFNGALAAVLSSGRGYWDALLGASAVAGLSVLKRGTSKSIPTIKEVQRFFKRNNLWA